MIIHSYFTDGYIDWAEIYLKSFKLNHGENYQIILNTRNLNNKQIKSLYSLYKNLKIKNEKLDLSTLAKKSNLSYEKLLKMKNEVEKIGTNSKNFRWKLIIAGEDRIKALYNEICQLNENDFIFHSDIDLYCRGKLDLFFDVVCNNDFSTNFRFLSYPKINLNDNKKILINLQGIKVSKITKEFYKKWIDYIEKSPISKRKRGYGQTSCYYAYLDMKKKYGDEFRCGNFPSKLFGMASISNFKSNEIIWFANKGNKKENIEKCKEDFKRMELS